MEGGTLTQVVDQLQAQVTRVPLSSLLPGDSPRLVGQSEEHIETIAQSECKLPPILVHRQTMRVIDGMHRLSAAKLRGEDEIEVKFFDGNLDAAFVLAVESNMAHGLPLSLADRTAAAARIIASYPEWSDRAIAKSTGLAAGTIKGIRQRSTADLDQLKSRIGRDGRHRPLDSADRRKRASELIAEKPHASLREIAREVSISPSTVRDVRDRIYRGEDPIPPQQRRSEVDLGRPRSIRSHRPERGKYVHFDNPASTLEKLRKDPSLRFNEVGRSLLRWVSAQIFSVEKLPDFVTRLPPHSYGAFAELARTCANRWNLFADELDQRSR
ncbi:MAG: ParB N-terminal domain-containing protein [Pseudonocardiaceae bacterium]